MIVPGMNGNVSNGIPGVSFVAAKPVEPGKVAGATLGVLDVWGEIFVLDMRWLMGNEPPSSAPPVYIASLNFKAARVLAKFSSNIH